MRRGYASFFWPAILILVGVFALLVNANLLSADRLYRLFDLWPLILVVIGLELIVRRAFSGPTAELAATLIVVLAVAGSIAYVAVGPALPGGTQTLDAHDTVGELTAATLNVDAGAATITVTGSSSLGGDLYKAHITYSGNKPDVSLDRSSGDLTISQNGNFGFLQNRRLILDLQISSSVPWTIIVNSGAATDTFNLGTVNVASIELNTGASREDITLGPPKGQVPVTINGGALTVNVHRPPGTAASVQVSGAAINLTADGHGYHGFGSQSWQSSGYDSAADSYRIEVNGGASNVTIDANASVG
jgi:hypothetical protein